MSIWVPPSGFVPVSSAVEGVTVWALAEEGAAGPLRCAACGGPWSAGGSLVCAWCGHEETAAAYRDPEGGAKAFSLDALDQSAPVMEGALQLSCSACGASWEEEPGHVASVCPFCAVAAVVDSGGAHPTLRPSSMLPLTLSAAEARAHLSGWLGGGWLNPAALTAGVRLEELKGVFLPWWAFSADLHATWDAEIGREETRTTWDSDSNSYKTHTVIVWRREQGSVLLQPRDHLTAATERLAPALLAGVADYDLSAMVPFQERLLAGWRALQYDRALPESWEVARQVLRGRALKACMDDTPTDHVRDLSASVDFREERWRHVLLPVYLSSFRYRDRTWQVMVNGQTGTVSGQRPVAWGRVWWAIAAMMSPAIATALLGVLLLIVGIGLIFLALSLILAAAGGFASLALYRHAVSMERG
ncbi:MAG: hypothetical protein JXX28_14640 [Deltaproteobacteria bacterium]|nr:hypothetical protein [Deltaproteobacteria bacterium]